MHGEPHAARSLSGVRAGVSEPLRLCPVQPRLVLGVLLSPASPSPRPNALGGTSDLKTRLNQAPTQEGTDHVQEVIALPSPDWPPRNRAGRAIKRTSQP